MNFPEYELPPASRLFIQKELRDARGLNTAYHRLDEGDQHQEIFAGKRQVLQADAKAYFDARRLASKLSGPPAIPPKPLPTLPNNAAPRDVVEKLMPLTSGLLVGEVHSDLGSKKFLIEQMPALAAQGVKTLYMEHLLSDVHQDDLDHYFGSPTAVMPKLLADYLDALDSHQLTDIQQQYTFLNVVKAARQAGIHVIAIDCTASYYLKGLEESRGQSALQNRLRMMNYFAQRVISHREAGESPSKWVAFIGNAHLNETAGIPGLAELTGGISVRFADTKRNRFEPDPGLTALAEETAEIQAQFIQADYSLEVKIPPERHVFGKLDLTNDLTRPNQFFVDTLHQEIRHYSLDGHIYATSIQRDLDGFYVEQPEWRAIGPKRYAKLAQLVSDLQRQFGLILIVGPEYSNLPSPGLSLPNRIVLKDVEIYYNRLVSDKTPLASIVAGVKQLQTLPPEKAIEIATLRGGSSLELGALLCKPFLKAAGYPAEEALQFKPAALYLQLLHQLVQAKKMTPWTALTLVLPQKGQNGSMATSIAAILFSPDPRSQTLSKQFLTFISAHYNRLTPEQQAQIDTRLTVDRQPGPTLAAYPEELRGLMTWRERLKAAPGDSQKKLTIDVKLKGLAPRTSLLDFFKKSSPNDSTPKTLDFSDITGPVALDLTSSTPTAEQPSAVDATIVASRLKQRLPLLKVQPQPPLAAMLTTPPATASPSPSSAPQSASLSPRDQAPVWTWTAFTAQDFEPPTEFAVKNLLAGEQLIVQLEDDPAARAAAIRLYLKEPAERTLVQLDPGSATYRLVASRGQLSTAFGGPLNERTLPNLPPLRKLQLVGHGRGDRAAKMFGGHTADTIVQATQAMLQRNATAAPQHIPKIALVGCALEHSSFNEAFQLAWRAAAGQNARPVRIKTYPADVSVTPKGAKFSPTVNDTGTEVESLPLGDPTSPPETRALAPSATVDESEQLRQLSIVDGERLARRCRQTVQLMLADTPSPQRWVPLLSTLAETPEGRLTLRFSDRLQPELQIERTTDDRTLLALNHLLERARSSIGSTENLAVAPLPEGPHGLNNAFAAQALIRWLWGKQRTDAVTADDAIDKNILLAVQIQEQLGRVQMGLGVLQDSAQLATLVQAAASARIAAPSLTTTGLKVVERSSAAANVVFNIANIAFDGYELARAETEAQRALFGTHLAFDSANFGLGVAAMAGAEAAGPLGVVVAGLGVATAGLVDAFDLIAQGAANVGAYFDATYKGYIRHTQNASAGYGYNPANQRLDPAPHVVLQDLNLKLNSVRFESPRIYPSKHGRTGSGKINYFFWAGDKPHVEHDRNHAFHLLDRLGIRLDNPLPAAATEATTVVLPAMPLSYITYRHEMLPFALTRQDAGFAVLRQLEADDFDFDFYVFPAEYIINQLSFEYVSTPVNVTLGRKNRYLQMPVLPENLRGYLDYRLVAEGGEYVIGLQPGASLLLDTENAGQTTWILDTRGLDSDRLTFEGQSLNIGGVNIRFNHSDRCGTIRLVAKNTEVREIDLIKRCERLLEIDAQQWQTAQQDLHTHLRALAQQHLLAAHYIQVDHYRAPTQPGRPGHLIPRAHYEVAKDRYLYIDDTERYPDVELAVQSGDNVYFYTPAHDEALHVHADTHQVLGRYSIAGAERLRLWAEQGNIFLSETDARPGPVPIYCIVDGHLELHRIHGEKRLLAVLDAQDHLPDVVAALGPYLNSAHRIAPLGASNHIAPLGASNRITPLGASNPALPLAATLPSTGYVVIDALDEQTLKQRYWIRPRDGKIIKITLQPPVDLALAANERLADGSEVFYFYSAQQQQIYRQLSLSPTTNDTQTPQTERIELAKLLSVVNLKGLLYACTLDGTVYHLDADGKLNWTAVNQKWLSSRPRWWAELRQLPRETALCVLDVKDREGRAVAVWLKDGTLVVGSNVLPNAVNLLGFTPGRTDAWLYHADSGTLYRQPLMSENALAQTFSPSRTGDEPLSTVPAAQPQPRIEQLNLLGNTMTLQLGAQPITLPLIEGVRQLILVSDSRSAAYTIPSVLWEHYQRIIIDHDDVASSGTPTTTPFLIPLTVTDPSALRARREQHDLILFDPSRRNSIQLRGAFDAHRKTMPHVQILFPNRSVDTAQICALLAPPASDQPLRTAATRLPLTPTLLPTGDTKIATLADALSRTATADTRPSPTTPLSRSLTYAQPLSASATPVGSAGT